MRMDLLFDNYCDDWEYRYYSFDATWGEGENMASMRGSDGEHYFALFREDNVIIKGLELGFPLLHKRIQDFNVEQGIDHLLPAKFCDFFSHQHSFQKKPASADGT